MESHWYEVSVVQVSKYRIQASDAQNAMELVYEYNEGEEIETWIDDVFAELADK